MTIRGAVEGGTLADEDGLRTRGRPGITTLEEGNVGDVARRHVVHPPRLCRGHRLLVERGSIGAADAGRAGDESSAPHAATAIPPGNDFGDTRHATTLSDTGGAPDRRGRGGGPGIRPCGGRELDRSGARIGSPGRVGRPFLPGERSSHGEHTFVSMAGTKAELVGAMSHPVRRVTAADRGRPGLRSWRRRVRVATQDKRRKKRWPKSGTRRWKRRWAR